MNADVAGWITGGTVVAATCIYGAAALQAFSGAVPGPYVSLLTYAPLGLMATSVPLMYSVFRVVVPDNRAAIMLAVAALSGTAFQAAALSGEASPRIGVLALANLCMFYYAAKRQGALTAAERRARYDDRARLAESLNAARGAVSRS